jgi:hypothetical protein
MLKYFHLLNNEDNEELVTNILSPITEGDLITEAVVQENLAKLQLLLSIGEREIFEAVVQDLLEDETYSKYMSGETGA